MDLVTEQRINTTHPAVRDNLLLIIRECDLALTGRAKIRITEALRTVAYQNDLYALGRTKVNPNGKSPSRPLGYKVTNAKGGDSIHNYGLAVDFCLIIDGREASWDDAKDWDEDGKADWMEVVAIFERHGWSWGGRWSSFVDKPHFEKTFGYSLGALRQLREKGVYISGTDFVQLNNKGVKTEETTADVNFRMGPGTDYKVIRVLLRRTPVEVLSYSGDWARVKIEGSIGWVHKNYIK